MKTTFKNVVDLLEYFDNQEKCKKILALQRWGDGGPLCPHCEGTHVYVTNRGYKCGNKDCHKKFTVLTGTMFENTKIKLKYWFAAIYILTSHKKGISAKQMAKDLGVAYPTAWFMMHRIREMVMQKKPEILKGTVEVDETYVGGKMKNKHAKVRRAMRKKGTGYIHKTPVMGFVERGTGKLQYVVITHTNAVDGTIAKPLIRALVDKEATLITDSMGAYAHLNKEYHHEIINHSGGEYGRGIYHTNTIEGAFSILKRGIIGIYHYISPKHMQRYCNEFSFRYSTKHLKDDERFIGVLKNAPGTRLTYKRLTNNGKN